MLYSEIIAVCSEIHTKHINTLCGQNVDFCIAKLGGTCSNHQALKGCHMSLHVTSQIFFFLGGGEGPRSRCYGRTAALRLIMQHCDEDEEKDD
jgi:hypothetical protein